MGGFYGAFGFGLTLAQAICLTFNLEYLFQYKTPSITIKYWEFVVNLSSYNTSISVITAFTVLLLPSLLGQMGTLPSFPIPHTLSAFTHCILTTLELSLPNYNDSIKKARLIQYYIITKIPIVICIGEILLAINYMGNITVDMIVIVIILIVNQIAKLPFVIEVRRARPISPVFQQRPFGNGGVQGSVQRVLYEDSDGDLGDEFYIQDKGKVCRVDNLKRIS